MFFPLTLGVVGVRGVDVDVVVGVVGVVDLENFEKLRMTSKIASSLLGASRNSAVSKLRAGPRSPSSARFKSQRATSKMA